MRIQTPILTDNGCFGNSYPQIGQTFASFSTSIAQPGHSLILFWLISNDKNSQALNRISVTYIIIRSKSEVPMNTQNQININSSLIKSRNVIAAISSIIPGLGHIYKGQYRIGAGLLITSPFLIWIALIMGFATAGFGLLIPFFYLIAIGWHAYNVEDKRRHPAGII